MFPTRQFVSTVSVSTSKGLFFQEICLKPAVVSQRFLNQLMFGRHRNCIQRVVTIVLLPLEIQPSDFKEKYVTAVLSVYGGYNSFSNIGTASNPFGI